MILKFQVISIDGGPDKLLKKGRYIWKLSLPEFFKIYIEDPIVKKTKKYGGKSVSGVILLIHALRMPGTKLIIERKIINNKDKLNELGETSGFNKIYLIFDFEGEVIDLYKTK